MIATQNLIKPYISKSELIEITFMGQVIGPDYKTYTSSICSKTSACYVKNPILILQFNKSVYNINTSDIFKAITLEFMGVSVDQLRYEDIVTYQDKYNIHPLKIPSENIIIFPLPFEWMSKDRGIVVSNHHQLLFQFIFSENEDIQFITDMQLHIEQYNLNNDNIYKLLNNSASLLYDLYNKKDHSKFVF